MFETLDWQLAVRERALDMALGVMVMNDEGRMEPLNLSDVTVAAAAFEAFLLGNK